MKQRVSSLLVFLALQTANGFGGNFIPMFHRGIIPQRLLRLQLESLRTCSKFITMSASEKSKSALESNIAVQSSRRSALIFVLVALSSRPFAWSEGDTKLYKGPSAYGFEFRYPTGWKPNKKIGNRHLYDLEVRSTDGGSSIGVTIDQITSNSTEQWSPLDDAAERLRSQYEKQSGKKATIKSKTSERDASGLTYYAFTVELEGGAQFLTRLTTTAQVCIPSSLSWGKEGNEIKASAVRC